MAPTILHLRSETKPLEHRSALTPTTAKALIDDGKVVNVERSKLRIFDDNEFEQVGATLVDEGSWVKAPKEHLIVGLKELPEEDFPLHHTHVQFAHCYKGQTDWAKTLARFPKGGGILYDLEFLQDDSGRRVAAFGYHAGYAGAALAILVWAHQLQDPKTPYPSIASYPDAKKLVAAVQKAIESAKPLNDGKSPRVHVMGALGRCGRGATDLCKEVGLADDHIAMWDLEETKEGGPFPQIAQADIFVNCIYLGNTPIPPFINKETLLKAGEKRPLRVVCDVSCDPNNPQNPVPIYDDWTTFDKPTSRVDLGSNVPPLDVISIDHLPSLLPRESSEAFSNALLPSLKQLDQRHEARVWKDAEKLFQEKVNTLPKGSV